MKTILLLITLFAVSSLFSQSWTWTELDTMPMRTANNSVTSAQVGNETFVYSFGGIDTTKLYSGIHQKSFVYNYNTDTWSTLPDLPDTLGKIAAAASTINGKIYILGGYYVFQNNSELSSNKIHIFDPQTNTFLADGTDANFPIDDHIQVTWRDSLLYSIAGWSDGITIQCQVYDSYNDSWQNINNIPANGQYGGFGASGTIIGDTVYYFGGAAGGQFVSQNKLRKGIIEPNNPTQINWEYLGPNSNGGSAYRAGAFAYGKELFWVGGTSDTYNFDGISYGTNQGLEPLDRILNYDAELNVWTQGLGQPYNVMDMRGVAQVESNKWIVCGGMEENQNVSNKTYLIELDTTMLSVNNYNQEKEIEYLINIEGMDKYSIVPKSDLDEIRILDYSGKTIFKSKNPVLKDQAIKFSSNSEFLIITFRKGKTFQSRKVKIQ